MKISCRADFPKISRTLVIDGYFDGDAVVWIMDSDKVQLLTLGKFNDWNSAIDYYIAKFLLLSEKEDFDSLYVALDNFKAIADELVVLEDSADRVADTIRKCKGE